MLGSSPHHHRLEILITQTDCLGVEQIGDETHFGLVYPRLGKRKMGAFGLYTGRLVDLLDSREQVRQYLIDRPGTIVLVHEKVADEILGGRIDDGMAVRELRTGRDRYLVAADR